MIKLFTIVTFLMFQNLNRDSVISNFNHYSSYNSPEKLYLHIDRNIFVSGETLFFKGSLINSSQNSQLPLSNYIYVELLGRDTDYKNPCKIKPHQII